MINSFSSWLKKKDEAFGGSAGDPSNAGLDQPENGERQVTAYPNSSMNGDDLPITKKNKINKLTFAKKNCNCK